MSPQNGLRVALAVTLLTLTNAATAAAPIHGGCYFGEFRKTPLVSPPGWWIWPSNRSAGFFSDFSLMVSADGRHLDKASNAQFRADTKVNVPPAAYVGIDLLRGSHNGLISPDGKFRGASRTENETSFGSHEFTAFRGQFLRRGRVIFKFSTHIWGGRAGDGRLGGRDFRTGWITARGTAGRAACGHDFPMF